MNPLLVIGTRVVVLALLAYTVGIVLESRQRLVTNGVLIFLILGVLADITATACMILGSTNSPFTWHGFIGYTALAAMLLDTIFMGRWRLYHGIQSRIPQALHWYSLTAYLGWVLVFITGAIRVILT